MLMQAGHQTLFETVETLQPSKKEAVYAASSRDIVFVIEDICGLPTLLFIFSTRSLIQAAITLPARYIIREVRMELVVVA